MTKLEEVKAALIAADEATGGSRHIRYWDDMARAAIEALREPTKAMRVLAADPSKWPSFEAFWRAQIDAILSEGE